MSEASEYLSQRLKQSGIRHGGIDAHIAAVLNELAAIKEAHARLSAIYTERGKMVAEMRELLNKCS